MTSAHTRLMQMMFIDRPFHLRFNVSMCKSSQDSLVGKSRLEEMVIFSISRDAVVAVFGSLMIRYARKIGPCSLCMNRAKLYIIHILLSMLIGCR